MKKMATNHSSCYNAAEEDYIDMDLSSCSSSFSFFANATTSSSSNGGSSSSPHQSRREEFEFQIQMSSSSSSVPEARDSTTSPADELFYKGNLLPLHLPPRLQMVQKLLQQQTSTSNNKKDTFFQEQGQQCSSSNSIAVVPSSSSTTISPSESCRVSCELNPAAAADYFFQWSTELKSFIHSNSHHHHPKKSCWSNKLRLIKQSSTITQKLKASRIYLKSLFTKSPCSVDESSAKTCNILDSRECSSSNKYIKVAKKNPFGYIGGGGGTFPTPASVAKSIEKEAIEETNIIQQRRSFSGAIKRHSSISPSKCLSSSSSSCSSSSSSSGASSLSSSFSINSNVLYDLQYLRRSSSAASELEGASIEAAIAHCKSSQQTAF